MSLSWQNSKSTDLMTIYYVSFAELISVDKTEKLILIIILQLET